MRSFVLAFSLIFIGCGSDTDETTPPVDSSPIDSGGTDTSTTDTATTTDAPATDATDATDTASGDASDAADTSAALVVTSTAFTEGSPIPVMYTCSGAGVSPPLAWSGAPTSTKSFALIMDDPDAPGGTFTHWVLFDIPGTTSSLAEGTTGVGIAGKNSFGASAYGGPCPPSGKAHRYFFKLFALDLATTGLATGATRSVLETTMSGHVVAQGSLMGTFAK